MTQIFISYRRADTAEMSRRIYDELIKHTHKKNVFRDVDTLMKGHDFRAEIERFIFQSDVMLVLIGDDWLTICDTETGEYRLHNPDDFVRIEVEMGLRHMKRMIPVLVNGATMPTETELPPRLSSLVFKDAVQIHDDNFDEDFQVLLSAIGIRRQNFKWVLGLLALIVIGVLGFSLLNPNNLHEDQPEATISATFDATQVVLQPDIIQQTQNAVQTEQFNLTLTPSFQSSPTTPATLTPTDEPIATVVLTSDIPETAFLPIANNQDWTPIERDFEGVMMMLVPVGCFVMGEGGLGGEQCFDKPFWVDKTEVTQADFSRLGGVKARANAFDGANLPVENITWGEAQAFCELRGGRLPTEAEWEYVARGVDGSMYPWGDVWNPDHAVYRANSNAQTALVGSVPDGASWVGALDMVGNVWEWTNSLYKDYPYRVDDGREDQLNTEDRVMRGSSWYTDDASFMIASVRSWFSPNSGLRDIGLRCVMTIN